VLITGIKSKPVYTPLSADIGGRYHLMMGLGVGAAPLLRVVAQMRSEAPSALQNTHVLYVPPSDDTTHAHVAAFQSAGVAEIRTFDNTPGLLAAFNTLLTQALMGTRLYVAGPESFMGLAMKIALQFNLNKDEIRAEESGSLARRVHCVHCRAETEEVRTNIVQCIGCSRWLLVRDHYSRRLAAYMGVMADAEAPGELPPVQDVFV
jgi:ferredoxin-NADP reductase